MRMARRCDPVNDIDMKRVSFVSKRVQRHNDGKNNLYYRLQYVSRHDTICVMDERACDVVRRIESVRL